MKTRTVRLDTICERIEYGFTASADFSIKEPRLLRITDIQEGSVDWNHVPGCRITPEEEADKRLCAGDIVFARTGATTGKCFLIEHAPRAVFASYLIRLRATDEILPHYLYAFLQSENYWHQIKGAVRGAAQGGVNSTTLSSLVVPLPDLTEQRQIAGPLKQADRLRRTRRNALELTDTFLPAAFLELFADQNPAVNPWPAVPLGEHLEAIEGGVNFNPVGENDPASDWRVLKVSAVSWSDFLAEESKPISPTESFSEKLVVQRGDLIMSRANTVELVGAVARVRTPPPKVLLPDKLWRLRFRASSQLLPDYLLYALRSRAVRREIEIRASGTSGSMKNISKEDVRELRLPLPPLPLQQKFAALVERVERLRSVQREALRQAEHLFASLLHRAFSA